MFEVLRPSHLFRFLLQRVLGPQDQDAVGDLEEEYHRRRNAWAPAREAWYAREAISLLFAVAFLRLRVGAPEASHARSAPLRPEREAWPEGLGRDVRHVLRSLIRDPGTTVVVGLTLSAAIGATAAIGAVADAAFLRPLPFPAADRLVRIYSGSRQDADARTSLSPLDLRHLEDYRELIEEVGAWTVGEAVHFTGEREPRRLEAPRVSAGFFDLLGARPELGRFFTGDAGGVDGEVVLSHGLWMEAFGGDAEVIGTSIQLDGVGHQVVGVAPRSGMLPPGADVWRSLVLGPEWFDPSRVGWQFLGVLARLRPGVDAVTAAELLTARLAEWAPRRAEQGQTRVVRTLYQERRGTTGTGVAVLLGAVGLLLALACANVMNVMLARAERRLSEFALRRALGSGGGSLVRLVLVETVLLAAVGGIGGFLLAGAAMYCVQRADLPLAYLATVQLDVRLVGLVFLLTVGTAAAFGAMPILRVLGVDATSVLRGSVTRTGASRTARRARDSLVLSQVAIATILLAAVGSAASTFLGILQHDPGFRFDGILTAEVELPAGPLAVGEGATFYRMLMERLRSVPGVDQAGAVAFLPLAGVGWSASFDLVDPDPSITDPDPGANMRPVTPGYFETLRIPTLAGRTFSDGDDAGDPPVVVIDEVLRQRYWPTGSAVGEEIIVPALSPAPASIVGVVGSVPDEGLDRPSNGHVYFPVLQSPERRMTVVIHTSGDAASLASALRRAVHDTDPRVPVTKVSTLRERVKESLAPARMGVLLLAVFGGVALFLAGVGVFGVLSYTVALRTGEIGTRIALGATPAALRRTIVLHALRLWVAGTAVGIVGALACGWILSRYIDAFATVDSLPYAGVLLALAGTATLAALLPAHRATSVDPALALRSR